MRRLCFWCLLKFYKMMYKVSEESYFLSGWLKIIQVIIKCNLPKRYVSFVSEPLILKLKALFLLLSTEFIPYVFQVMSLLLETHKNDIPSSYMALFPHLLQPVLWERTGNIPALVRLLQAFLERGSNTIASAAADKIVSQIYFDITNF